ncbi:MAG: MerR family transcriptional regulator [Phreatobacter sp.]|uniref:MerR family transcriptional regulator n=1 Tax=Phreatobacter sp. TaxID=1966341 RepID=UPI002736BC0A|nr:MerR family transcriptional regulator [Phreatobacter sp.]MDP2802079.1 MerR family transcriptional regulator [Phreatobacter sp.]
MDKAPDAYRTISEVADDLDLPQHVLRFWETRFSQIRPLKRGGGRRYYRPDDIDLLKGIRHLLYGEGYTIRGVQRIIKESGVKAIQAIGRGEGAATLPKPKGPDIIDPALDEDEDETADGRPLAMATGSSPAFAAATYGEPPFAAAPTPVAEDDDFDDAGYDPAVLEPAFEPRPAPRPSLAAQPLVQRAIPVQEQRARPVLRAPTPVAVPELPTPVRPAVEMPSMRAAAPSLPASPAVPPVARLAADDVRRLQAALYELLECRKRLDAAFDGR